MYLSNLNQIPLDISRFSSLTDLYIDGEDTLNIMNSIKFNSKLDTLRIYAPLEMFPIAICDLENLEYLTIENGCFDSLPSEIINLYSIVCININSNYKIKLTDEQKEWIKELAEFKDVEIYINDVDIVNEIIGK